MDGELKFGETEMGGQVGVEHRATDPDYAPEYQDEYQRLWHREAAKVVFAKKLIVELVKRHTMLEEDHKEEIAAKNKEIERLTPFVGQSLLCDFYRCPHTGELVYRWSDERLALQSKEGSGDAEVTTSAAVQLARRLREVKKQRDRLAEELEWKG